MGSYVRGGGPAAGARGRLNLHFPGEKEATGPQEALNSPVQTSKRWRVGGGGAAKRPAPLRHAPTP